MVLSTHSIHQTKSTKAVVNASCSAIDMSVRFVSTAATRKPSVGHGHAPGQRLEDMIRTVVLIHADRSRWTQASSV